MSPRAFNYSTGPVALTAGTRLGLVTTFGSSHMPDASEQIASALEGLRTLLRVPDTHDVVLLPGSIRQALDTVTASLSTLADSALALEDGYWGGFIGDLLVGHGASVTRVSALAGAEVAQGVPLATAVHMETETGRILPLDLLWEVKRQGGVTLLDAACTAPIHAIDFEVSDVVVLGSHKCLAAAPGLSILLIRRSLELPGWTIGAYRSDSRWRSGESAMAMPPLPTYPMELVAALDESVQEILRAGDLTERARRASTQIREGAERLGLKVHDAPGEPSLCVTRLDVPDGANAALLQAGLLERGYFVIGNVGASRGTSIRVGTMSLEQCASVNVNGFLAALADSLAAARAA